MKTLRSKKSKDVTLLSVRIRTMEYGLSHGHGATLAAAVKNAAENHLRAADGGRESPDGWTVLAILPGHLRRRQLVKHLTVMEMVLLAGVKGESHARH
jgi:hypothetical protein